MDYNKYSIGYLVGLIDNQEFDQIKYIIKLNVLNDDLLIQLLECFIVLENIEIIKLISLKINSLEIERKFMTLISNYTNPEIIYSIQQFISPQTLSYIIRKKEYYVIDLIEEDKLKKIKFNSTNNQSSPMSKLLDQKKINDLAIESIYSNHLLIINRLLEGFYGLKPSQYTINQMFQIAIKRNKYDIAYILCNYKENKITVNINTINSIFIETVDDYNIDGVKWMLTNKIIFPDLELIEQVYFDYQIYIYENRIYTNNTMIELLQKYIRIETINRVNKYIRCLEERKARVRRTFNTFNATEIHGYSRSNVHLRKNLNESVLEVINQKIQGMCVMSESEIFVFLTDKIREHVTIGKQTKALERIGQLLDSTTIELFGSVIVYLNTFYSSHIEVWIKGFIEESVQANSCHAGALERVVTGLRGISDNDINELFLKAEGPQLFRIFLKEGLNIFGLEPKYQANHKRLIEQIKTDFASLNVTNSNDKSTLNKLIPSEDDVKIILDKYIRTSIESFGLSVEEHIMEAMTVIDLIVDSYESHILPYLV
jgi:hypothetical protein